MSETKKGRVIGIGGIFFKSTDPKAQRNWYQQHLGLVTNEYGSLFEFTESERPDQITESRSFNK
jgi:hypothetical protein